MGKEHYEGTRGIWSKKQIFWGGICVISGREIEMRKCYPIDLKKQWKGYNSKSWAGGMHVVMRGVFLLSNTWRFPMGSWTALANGYEPSSTRSWTSDRLTRDTGVLCFPSGFSSGLPKAATQRNSDSSVVPHGLSLISVWCEQASPSTPALNTIPLFFPLLLLLSVLYCWKTLKIWSAKMEMKIRI